MHRKTVYFEHETDGAVEVAMQWNSSYQESVFSFANNINTHEGGSHLSGFRSADPDPERLRTGEGPVEGEGREPLRRGRARGPHRGDLGQARRAPIRGQTKTKLGNPPVEGLVKETVNRKLGEFLEENPAERAGS